MEQSVTHHTSAKKAPTLINTIEAGPGNIPKETQKAKVKKPWWQYVTPYIPRALKDKFLAFDRKVDGAASFFIKHYGKSRFMIAMSKKAQYLGLERLWEKGPKAFIYFFLFYLVRDTILYIIIPIYFAYLTTS